MISDTQAEKCNDYIRDHAPKLAEAKAQRIYLEEFRKTQKAILFQQAPAGTVQDRESYAYAHKDYQTVIEGLKAAVEQEEELRWKMIAAQTKIEIFRTQQASSRRGF